MRGIKHKIKSSNKVSYKADSSAALLMKHTGNGLMPLEDHNESDLEEKEIFSTNTRVRTPSIWYLYIFLFHVNIICVQRKWRWLQNKNNRKKKRFLFRWINLQLWSFQSDCVGVFETVAGKKVCELWRVNPTLYQKGLFFFCWISPLIPLDLGILSFMKTSQIKRTFSATCRSEARSLSETFYWSFTAALLTLETLKKTWEVTAQSGRTVQTTGGLLLRYCPPTQNILHHLRPPRPSIRGRQRIFQTHRNMWFCDERVLNPEPTKFWLAWSSATTFNQDITLV